MPPSHNGAANAAHKLNRQIPEFNGIINAIYQSAAEIHTDENNSSQTEFIDTSISALCFNGMLSHTMYSQQHSPYRNT